MNKDNLTDHSKPTSWLCTDGTTIRAGDKGIGIWWTVSTQEQADAIVAMMHRFSRSELRGMFCRGM
jgi:hypothetical protein